MISIQGHKGTARSAAVTSTLPHRRADGRDRAVGHRVRARRLELKLSQSELASQIGVTFQQVQKYEKGVNRIGAGRLQRIAETLEMPISDFFGVGVKMPHEVVGRAYSEPESIFDKMQSKDVVRLVQAFHKMKRGKTRVLFVQLAEAIVEEQG